MTISVGSDQFKNIVEIWDSGPNTLHVVTASYRTIRVSALGNIRSGTAPNYFAHYEEHVEIEPKPGQRLRVWADAHFPWQDGADVEECLLRAVCGELLIFDTNQQFATHTWVSGSGERLAVRGETSDVRVSLSPALSKSARREPLSRVEMVSVAQC